MTSSVKRFSCLTTPWSRLLAETDRHNTLMESEQRICERHTFYKLMDAMTRIGWMECVEETRNGCIRAKYYRVTFEGAIIAEAFKGKL